MNKHSRSKSGLFLMELIIVIMFFSISAAICMRMFSTAKIRSDYSRDISNASVIAQSCAESFKAYDGDISKTAAALEGAESKNAIKVFYDEEWNRTNSEKEAKYILTLVKSNENAYKDTGKIEVEKKSGDSLVEITVLSAHQKVG